jgi:hypothetical protein
MEVSMTDSEVLTKAEVLEELTKLYDICMNSSYESIDSWSRIASVISTAEDVVIQEMKDE